MLQLNKKKYMQNLEIYCVTDKEVLFRKNELQTRSCWAGKFSSRYIKCDNKDNISIKKKLLELTFHYWFWKNELRKYNQIHGLVYKEFWLKDKIKIKNFKTLKKFDFKTR